MVQPCELPTTELFTVEHLKHLDSLLQLSGHSDGGVGGVGEGPGSLLQHSDEVVDAHISVGVGQERGELLIEVPGGEDVREHAMELGCELVAAGLLQSVDHGLLHVHAVALHVDQPLAQGPRVELLEHVLVVQIFEDCDAAGQLVINFCLGDSFARLLEQ